MELTMNAQGFTDLSLIEMEMVDGGGIVGKICATVGATATIVGGIAGLCVPEPTMATKVAGWSAIVAGVGWMGDTWL